MRRNGTPAPQARSVGEYTLAEIFLGKGDELVGLVPMIHSYLDALHLDVNVRCRLNQYIDFVGARADGSLATTATWIRQFVHNHPAYKHDSVITEEINYEMLCTLDQIERGVLEAPGYLPAGYAARRRALDSEMPRAPN